MLLLQTHIHADVHMHFDQGQCCLSELPLLSQLLDAPVEAALLLPARGIYAQ